MVQPLPFPAQLPPPPAGYDARLRDLTNRELEIEHLAQSLEQTLRELARTPHRLVAMRPRLEEAAREIGQRRAALQAERRALETARSRPDPTPLESLPVVTVQITPAGQHTFWTDLSGHIRTGGLFVATRDMLPTGTRLLVRLGLPDQRLRSVRAEVVWQREPTTFTADLPPGLGLRLLEPEAGLLAAIQAHIQHWPTLLFELVA